MAYQMVKKKGEFVGGRNLPLIHVYKDDEVIFKFPIQGELIFATVSLNRLWVLEHTPVGDYSTDVDLETGKACSRQMRGDNWGDEAFWMYRNEGGKDRWLRKV